MGPSGGGGAEAWGGAWVLLYTTQANGRCALLRSPRQAWMNSRRFRHSENTVLNTLGRRPCSAPREAICIPTLHSGSQVRPIIR